MAFMLGRHGMFLELNEDVEDYEDLTEIMSNVQLNSNFLALAREVRGVEHPFFFFFGGFYFTSLFINNKHLAVHSWTSWNLKCPTTSTKHTWKTTVSPIAFPFSRAQSGGGVCACV